jgi:hypothetical protein
LAPLPLLLLLLLVPTCGLAVLPRLLAYLLLPTWWWGRLQGVLLLPLLLLSEHTAPYRSTLVGAKPHSTAMGACPHAVSWM